jgi:polyhydroxyalkanoate synthesis regulator protein
MLPVNFLRQLIGLYGGNMQAAVPQYLEAAMDAFQQNQKAMAGVFAPTMFTDLAKRNMEMFQQAGRAFTGATPGTKDSGRDEEVEKLKAELAALKDKVDRLGK